MLSGRLSNEILNLENVRVDLSTEKLFSECLNFGIIVMLSLVINEVANQSGKRDENWKLVLTGIRKFTRIVTD